MGLALTAVSGQTAEPIIQYEVNGTNLIVTYTGTLYQSTDAVNWTEVKSASSPYSITLKDKKLFFCAKGETSEDMTIPLSDTVDLDMIWIEPGTFIMGSPEDELGRQSNETQHQVTLSKGYWLGKYEVTQVQYEAVMGTNPSSEEFIGADMPVNEVEWDDAKEFCQKLTEMVKAAGKLPEGYEYALPTEAQWEYACRAGTTTAFNNGTNIPSEEQLWWAQPCPNLDEVGWYCGDSDYTLHPVGQKKPNAWGLYDMHGNVFEWCSDWYGDYPTSAVTDPVGADTGSDRVYRGGGWGDTAGYCRSANRRYDMPSNFFYHSRGFRVALAPTKNITIPLAENVDLEMIWIKPGTFMMGSPEDELGRQSNETQHQVTLTQGYWLGKYEVTQAQYEAIMGANPSMFKGAALPVESVTWNDAKEFSVKLTAIEKAAGRLPEGYEYTLPTEAQWEYACRAGTTTALNSGKNLSGEWECPEMDEVGWYYSNCEFDGKHRTHPAGQKQPNAWGLYDMHGNIGEWCLDRYGAYPTSAVTDPTGPNTGGERVNRGGAWYLSAFYCRSAVRIGSIPSSYSNSTGFRVALAPVSSKDITIPLSEDVDLRMIWIEPGTFIMGSPKDELGRNSNETQHEVTLTQGYWLGKYEVTQAQYEAVTGSNPSEFIGADLPVEDVSWYEARAFCVKLTEIEKAAGRLPEGYEYTLPTEAQWEYACRAGTTTALNSGKNLSDKNECPEMDEVGWYRYNSGDQTHSVGQKKMNAWGLYDMHGNVEEWCQDWAKDYPAGAATDPTGPETGTYRIVRGGGWNEDARYCRSASRDISEPDSFWPNTGFRVALTQNVIERQPLTITINTTKVFDGTPLVSDYTVATVEGLLSGDKLTSGVVTTKSADTDSYSYIAGTSEITTPFATAYGIANYAVTYVITQDIFPSGLVITIKDTKLYDGTPLVSSYTKATATGLMPGDKLTAGAATSAKAEVGSYLYPGTSTITTPFATAYGIGNYTVVYIITQNIIQSDHSNKTIPLAEDVNLDMIWIEPGTFTMGSPESELGRQSNETQHQVTLTQGYWLGKYEVTQAQFKAVMGIYYHYHFWNEGDNLPVEEVSWFDATNFCATLTKIERAAGRLPEGYEYTLPTEAQWEYACRAGTTTALNNGMNLKSTGYMCPEIDEVGWYDFNSNDKTHPVGQKQPNNWGLYDMHGNVFEWCLDCFGNYPTSAVTDPFGAGTGSDRILRGGGFKSEGVNCRSATRSCKQPDTLFTDIGFRVALAPASESKDMTISLAEDVSLDMVWIEPGTFTMGSPTDELGRWDDETQHEVTLNQGYWLGKYEVTQAQYETIMGTNPSKFKGTDLPVERVTWYDAKEFCARLTASEKAAGRLTEGYEYTLPTEAQWEYACRAGTTTALNSGKNLSDADECTEMDEVGWYKYNSDRATHPVGQKLPNAWGLYDMHENVCELCSDWYGDYPASAVTDPTGPDTGSHRVMRGGSCYSGALYCRSAYRHNIGPGDDCYDCGFRVALASVK